jgi:hypothetical protein
MGKRRIARRLAAILAADVVGHSAMMAGDACLRTGLRKKPRGFILDFECASIVETVAIGRVLASLRKRA